MSRHAEVVGDRHASRAIERHAERSRQRRGRDARGPQHGVRGDPSSPSVSSPSVTPPASMCVTGTPVRISTPRRSSCRCAFADSDSGKLDSTRGPASSSSTRACARIDATELALEGMPRDLGQACRRVRRRWDRRRRWRKSARHCACQDRPRVRPSRTRTGCGGGCAMRRRASSIPAHAAPSRRVRNRHASRRWRAAGSRSRSRPRRVDEARALRRRWRRPRPSAR